MNTKIIFLLLALLLSLFSVSCKEEDTAPEYSYTMELIDIDSESVTYSSDSCQCFSSYEGDMVLALDIHEMLDDGKARRYFAMQRYDCESDEIITIAPVSYFGDDFRTDILNITGTPDGGYFVQARNVRFLPDEERHYGFTKYDSDGSPVFFVKADAYPTFKKADVDGAADVSDRTIGASIADADGNIYLYCPKKTDYKLSVKDPVTSVISNAFYYDASITVIAPDGEFICALYAEDGNVPGRFDFFRDESGKIKLLSYDDYLSPKVYGIDLASAKLTDPEPVDFQCDGDRYYDPAGNRYFSNALGFFSVTFDENGNQVDTLLFDWASIGISRDIIAALIVRNDSFITAKLVDGSENPEYCVIRKVKTGELPERTEIRIAVDGAKSSDNIVKALGRYNRAGESFYAEIVSYSTTEGGLSASQKLARDISAGKAPDVIVFNGDLSYELLKKELKFADLSKFIDSDKEFGRDVLLPCLYTAYQEESGEIPYISTYYLNSTISIDESITGELDGWTVGDMLKINESLADDEYFMARKYDDRVTAANDMLRELINGMMGEFIDYDKGECDFTGLAELLEICRTAKLFNTKDVDCTDQQNAKVAVEYDYFTNIRDLYKKLALGIQNRTDIGFPGTKEAKSGSLFRSTTGFSIMKTCKYPEECWKLIKEAYRGIEDEWNSIEGKSYFAFPLLLPMTVNDIEILNSYEGGVIFSVSQNGGVGVRRMPLDIPIYPGEVGIELTAERNQYLFGSINNYSRVAVKDPIAKAIILEEASYYFAGVKSLDETVRIITDRIETKISEAGN